MTKRRMIVLVSVLLLTASAQAGSLELMAGVTHSDVGLHKERGAATIGIARNVLPPEGPIDLTFGFEYVQRRGAQPRYFSHPTEGLILDDAVVTLHQLQPVALVGWSIPVSKFVPRLYGGISFAIKVAESWDQPEGETNGEIGYEDTDLLLHLGSTIAEGRYFIDFRFSWGLTKQVIDNTTFRVEKAAEDVAEGLEDFEAGNKVKGFHGGLGIRF